MDDPVGDRRVHLGSDCPEGPVKIVPQRPFVRADGDGHLFAGVERHHEVKVMTTVRSLAIDEEHRFGLFAEMYDVGPRKEDMSRLELNVAFDPHTPGRWTIR
ncbi:MAG: hypothetical protein CMH16_21665 [Methylobacterium sp.]|nr:hypothetical protein [Methylobacterium sp.]